MGISTSFSFMLSTFVLLLHMSKSIASVSSLSQIYLNGLWWEQELLLGLSEISGFSGLEQCPLRFVF